MRRGSGEEYCTMSAWRLAFGWIADLWLWLCQRRA